MGVNKKVVAWVKQRHVYLTFCNQQTVQRRCYNNSPFIEFYQKTTGKAVSNDYFIKLKKKHPNIASLSQERLEYILQILDKFTITALDACQNIHILSMNPITMDNYGEILRESGFVKILPKHIVKYHTIVRTNTIASLKEKGLLRSNLNLEQVLMGHFQQWPASHNSLQNFPDSTTSILTVRMNVLQKYLNWRLGVSTEEFNKYCRNYLPMRHKPMSDIQEALNIAENVIKFNEAGIRKNGFIISADPINTKLILENINSLAGLDIREAIKKEPAILKNNYKSLLHIKSTLEEYGISEEAQRKCIKVYCMCPSTVRERLDELRRLKEYQVLKTNPRVLSMVVHKMKMMDRLEQIYSSKKECYSLNHLISSSKVFNNYISSFGSKVCGRDLAVLISSSLQVNETIGRTELMKFVLVKLKRHKYWLHTTLNVINENIQFLKRRFADRVIFNNCQLLLYPVEELELYINFLMAMRHGGKEVYSNRHIHLDYNYNNLKYAALDDDQILSLVLYEIEKRYHFSGDGVWNRLDGSKLQSNAS